MHQLPFKTKLNYLIGEFLWKERNALGLTYESVTQFSGISSAILIMYEKGVIGVPLNSLLLLSKIYQIEKKEFHFFLNLCQEKAKANWSSADYLRIEIHQFKVGSVPKP